MPVSVPEVSYRELQAVLDGLGSAIGASEAHGCLCGALCARDACGTPEWIGELIEADAATRLDVSSRRLLLALHDEADSALRSQDFGFAPLVPDDRTALAERVQALADWCGGFLYGVGAAGPGGPLAVSGEIGEVLRDLAEIARARVDPRESAEAGEEAFVELFEFVRAGVQLTFDELDAARLARPQAGAAVH